jgi:hypothetical protein
MTLTTVEIWPGNKTIPSSTSILSAVPKTRLRNVFVVCQLSGGSGERATQESYSGDGV